ncbi:MAG: PD40 domain-containing protein, partial [Armatimonadetes bacterium]|nr:PD40 domain-containing protein [Armatimonadota bacterium]
MSRVTALTMRLALVAALTVPSGRGAAALATNADTAARLTARGMGLSPDGQLLVFVGRGETNTDVFTLSRKDAKVTRVTDGRGTTWTPSFSSDGLHVFYSMSPGTGERLARLFGRALDGSDTAELPLPQQRVFADTAGPAVSWDYKWMAFTAPPDPTLDKLSEQEREAQDAPWRLYLVRLGHPSSISYTTASAAEAAPAFSHDCALLTYRGEGFLPFGGACYWQLLGFSTDGALATFPVALVSLCGM